MTFITFFYLTGAVNKTDTIMPMNIQANINDSMCSLQQPNRNLATCNGNMECLFDYRATGDTNIALQTLTMSQRIVKLRSFVTPGQLFRVYESYSM
jgi:hypothetical protein